MVARSCSSAPSPLDAPDHAEFLYRSRNTPLAPLPQPTQRVDLLPLAVELSSLQGDFTPEGFEDEIELTAEDPLPSIFQSTTLPRKRVDPENRYRLSSFSSFTESEPGPPAKRLRRNEGLESARTRTNARLDIDLVAGAVEDVVAFSLPTTRRAGLQGNKLDRKRFSRLTSLPPALISSPVPSSTPPSPHPKLPRPSVAPSDPSTHLDTTSPPLLEPHPHSPPLSSTHSHIEAYLISADPRLASFTFSHRTNLPGKATTFTDLTPRAFATRIECPEPLSSLSDEVEAEIKAATSGGKAIRPIRHDGGRGAHEIRQIGVHREQGAARVGYSQSFSQHLSKWTDLMRREGFSKAREHVSDCLKIHYPLLFDHHAFIARSLASVGLDFLFGAFASICINTERVACRPHRDYHNLGPGICGIYPFGSFDSRRSGWVVLWEAKLVVQVGAGDVFLFPSAVFTHSNTAIHEDDERGSLAYWCSSSLFLWHECGMRGLAELGSEEQERMYEGLEKGWSEAWERFPVL